MYRSFKFLTLSFITAAASMAFAGEGGPSNNSTKINFDYSSKAEKACAYQQAQLLQKQIVANPSLKQMISSNVDKILINSWSTISERVEGVLMNADPDAQGDNVVFNPEKRTLEISSPWNTETKRCEAVTSGKYVASAIEGPILKVLQKELEDYFPADSVKINSDDGIEKSATEWRSAFTGNEEIDYKREKIFWAHTYNDQGDLDRKCARTQAKELRAAIANNQALGDYIKKENIKFELDFRTNHNVTELLSEVDPRVTTKLKYNANTKTIELLPLYKQFDDKSFHVFRGIPKVRCDIVSAGEIARKLSLTFNVNVSKNSEEAGFQRLLDNVLSSKNSDLDSNSKESQSLVKPLSENDVRIDAEENSTSAHSFR